MSPLTEPTRIILRNGWQPMDPDAAAYITAVETADGQALEEKVKIAIDNFVLGCKADGIWDAIKASCILAGARTLNGALVPLAGTAPTNFNFVSGDYDRKTGLVGNGSTKYLDSNRDNNADQQNNNHIALFSAVEWAVSNGYYYAGRGGDSSGGRGFRSIVGPEPSYDVRSRAMNLSLASFYIDRSPGLMGTSRKISSQVETYANSLLLIQNNNSTTPLLGSISIFANNNDSISGILNLRLAFYSIGEALDLALLDARVTTLMSDLAAAIP